MMVVMLGAEHASVKGRKNRTVSLHEIIDRKRCATESNDPVRRRRVLHSRKDRHGFSAPTKGTSSRACREDTAPDP